MGDDVVGDKIAAGLAALQRGDNAGALDAFDYVITHGGDDPGAHFYRGVCLYNLNRFVEALAAYDAAIFLEPRLFEAHANLGLTLQTLGKLETALAAYDRAAAIRPDFADIHNGRGNCLVLMDRADEGLAAFDRCLELDPNHALAANNKAILLHRERRFDEALALYDHAIAIAASQGVSFEDARYNRGLLHLTRGDFERGWPDYEYRLPGITSTVEQLRGVDFRGKHVYVRAEQGYGDTLQFVRYLPRLRAFGAHVTFECQAELETLLDASDLCDEVVERAPANAPLATPTDAVPIYVQSLPHLFEVAVSNMQSDVPYLRAPDDRAAEWKQRFDDIAPQDAELCRVGIVWSGNQADPHNRHRACSLADFAPLAAIDNVQFFSLQKGAASVQAIYPPPGMMLTELGDDLLDFADTAAAIEQLDLVITIDTSVAHLAGALGKPTWTLLPWSADWRWFLDRADSPWYPAMRLFRQPSAGAWASVMDAISAELSNFVK